jgi:enoyl-CoA hydratase
MSHRDENRPDQFRHLALTVHERYAVVRLNRAARLNSLSRETLLELTVALSYLGRGAEIQTIIVAGAAGVFSAGADLNEVAQLDPASALEFSRLGQETFARLRRPGLLTIAAIDGHCLGGGLDLALWCGRRLATPRSTFQHPGARRGIITGWGGTALLPRVVGRAHALRMLLTAERLTAGQALAAGLVDEVCDDVIARAVETAVTEV